MRLQFFAKNSIPGILWVKRSDQFHTKQCLLLTQYKVCKLTDTWYVWRSLHSWANWNSWKPLIVNIFIWMVPGREWNRFRNSRHAIVNAWKSSLLASTCMNVDVLCIRRIIYHYFLNKPTSKVRLIHNVHSSTGLQPIIKYNAMLQYRLKSISIKFPSSRGYDFICYQKFDEGFIHEMKFSSLYYLSKAN